MSAYATEQFIESLKQMIRDEVREALEARCESVNSDHGYYNTEDAADYLACPVSRIHDAAGAGALKGYKDGSRWLFTKGQLDDYVQSGGWTAPRPRTRSTAR